jgi:hypothetical protein
MTFTFLEIHCEIIRKDNLSEIPDIIGHLSKFRIKACKCNYDYMPPGGMALKNMVTHLQSAKCVPWFNKTTCVKGVQRSYLMEFGGYPPSKPPIYVFYRQFFERRCLCKGKISFAAKYQHLV